MQNVGLTRLELTDSVFFFHIAINHPLQVETSNSLSDLLLFGSSREWATALSLKNRMRWEGLHPDVITWNTLLSATSRWESILRPLVMLWVRFYATICSPSRKESKSGSQGCHGSNML